MPFSREITKAEQADIGKLKKRVAGGNIISTQSGVWARDANDFIFVVKIDDEKLYGLNMWRLPTVR